MLKNTIRALLAAFCVLAVFAYMPRAKAQTLAITQEVFSTPRSLAIQAPSDSAVGFDIEYSGSTYPELKGQYPDSIKVEYSIDADSTYNIYLRFKARHWGQSVYTSKLVDSLKSTTLTAKTQTTVIGGPDFYGYQNIGISLYAQSSGSFVPVHNAANAGESSWRITRYFKRTGVFR